MLIKIYFVTLKSLHSLGGYNLYFLILYLYECCMYLFFVSYCYYPLDKYIQSFAINYDNCINEWLYKCIQYTSSMYIFCVT